MHYCEKCGLKYDPLNGGCDCLPDSELLIACKAALNHVTELEEAWMTGDIRETDNLGGTRSNRNAGIRVQLSKAIENVSPSQEN